MITAACPKLIYIGSINEEAVGSDVVLRYFTSLEEIGEIFERSKGNEIFIIKYKDVLLFCTEECAMFF